MRLSRFSGRLAARLVAALALATCLVGCVVGDALVGGSCAAGYTQCGAHCVLVSSDPENCGTCGRACAAGAVCGAGECARLADATEDVPPESSPVSSDAPSDVTVSTGPDASAADGDGAMDAESRNETSAEAGLPDALPSDAPVGDATLAEGGPNAEGGVVDARSPSEASVTDTGAIEATTDGPASSDALSSDAPGDATLDDAATSSVDSAVDGGPAADTGPDDGASTDGAATPDATDPCMPFTTCAGQCVDLTNDPLNCGGCAVVCASQLCTAASCVGAASGGLVYIGHDYSTTLPNTAQARLLSNAVFVPQSNPLHVLSYERYANASALARVDTILSGVARQLGRTLAVQHTTSDSDVPNQLFLPNYDVLLVHDQRGAPDGALAALGASWSATLTTFTLGGGVVVVLDGAAGIGQMPDFSNGTRLLNVTAHFPVAVGTPLVVSSHQDVVGTGVISPYGAGQSSVSLATEPSGGNVVYVVELESDAGAGAPIAVHKGF